MKVVATYTAYTALRKLKYLYVHDNTNTTRYNMGSMLFLT